MPTSPRKREDVELKVKRMGNAQKLFRNIVRNELAVLLQRGVEREVAVRALLRRIVPDTEDPRGREVEAVMKQFRMNREDATRALIVKQELGRLKLRGLDPLAAIEELTLKMQGMSPVTPDEEGTLDSPSSRMVGGTVQVLTDVTEDEPIEDDDEDRPEESSVSTELFDFSTRIESATKPVAAATSTSFQIVPASIVKTHAARKRTLSSDSVEDNVWAKKIRVADAPAKKTPASKRSRSDRENSLSFEESVKRLRM